MSEYELNGSQHRIKKGAITNIANEFNGLDDSNNTVAATKLAAREYLNINRAKEEKIINEQSANHKSDIEIPTGTEIRQEFEAGEYR